MPLGQFQADAGGHEFAAARGITAGSAAQRSAPASPGCW
jgi:hypothetical protein